MLGRQPLMAAAQGKGLRRLNEALGPFRIFLEIHGATRRDEPTRHAPLRGNTPRLPQADVGAAKARLKTLNEEGTFAGHTRCARATTRRAHGASALAPARSRMRQAAKGSVGCGGVGSGCVCCWNGCGCSAGSVGSGPFISVSAGVIGRGAPCWPWPSPLAFMIRK